jgi:DNA-binding transcriptional MerR regulator
MLGTELGPGRYYDLAQLERGRLIAMLRQLGMPLTAVKELLACEPADMADRIAAFWRETEAVHWMRHDLADHLVNRLRGKRTMITYEVATREIPERGLLCFERNVDEQAASALGKEFIAIFQDRPLPRLTGPEDASFCIYWGEVNADSDGPVEWCRPVPDVQAETLASRYPELSPRTEPAHREAFVAFPWGGGRRLDVMASRILRHSRPGQQSTESIPAGSHSGPTISVSASPSAPARRMRTRDSRTGTSP